MRQRIRRLVIFSALLLFPVTLNYFSPYVSIDGAMNGLVAGSVLVFGMMFLSGLFFQRVWCSWICPMAGLSEICQTINNRPVPSRKLAIVRYTVFAVWFAILVTGFVLAGGIRGVDPLHLTERVISVDEPLKYITYYLVVLIFAGLSLVIGRRAACHTICWMSPFLVGGALLGRWLHLPQLHIAAKPAACIDCKTCDRKCPMSIPVSIQLKAGAVQSLDCIQCGECIDSCPKKVLRLSLQPLPGRKHSQR